VTFDEQLERMLQALPRRHRIVFLAGVRFVQGHGEHGAALFAKTPDELARDVREEEADAYTYRRLARWLQRRELARLE
jgi:hypothetical protein